ncbi:hypothetical protein M408DRAFT_171583 [Serendipita vermifera MAFF 305830]|uniref:Uncharacterized protein n=1 Tax=Serendipita vermifera MAFF 305830 TaxID=933852 RepID=A0A0C2XDU2_SERVB|nr:hypothetical protein M408DRAFT_171583 [Serendipita vermifera MAFF 305830]
MPTSHRRQIKRGWIPSLYLWIPPVHIFPSQMSQGKSQTSSVQTTVLNAENGRIPPAKFASIISVGDASLTVKAEKADESQQDGHRVAEEPSKNLEREEIEYDTSEIDERLVSLPPKKSFLRQHLFIITIVVLGTIITGVVVFLVVTATLNLHRETGEDTWHYIHLTVTDASGHVFTTSMHDSVSCSLNFLLRDALILSLQLTSMYMEGLSRSIASVSSASVASASSTTASLRL